MDVEDDDDDDDEVGELQLSRFEPTASFATLNAVVCVLLAELTVILAELLLELLDVTGNLKDGGGGDFGSGTREGKEVGELDDVEVGLEIWKSLAYEYLWVGGRN